MFRTIVEDCIRLLKHINPVLLKFTYRSANSVAHALTKVTYSMSESREWPDSPPDFILHVLQKDMKVCFIKIKGEWFVINKL